MSAYFWAPPDIDPDLDQSEADIDRDEARWNARWARMRQEDREAAYARLAQNYEGNS